MITDEPNKIIMQNRRDKKPKSIEEIGKEKDKNKMPDNEKITKVKNPLAQVPKRERTGSLTFKKYDYQYHWAFCRILSEHDSGNEYALFIEEHEDITLANSTDAADVLFEFNQIKETQKKHTLDSLTKITKGTKNSLLGKLFSGIINKSFKTKIKAVNFVSTGGYSFESHKKGFTFEVINCGDLSVQEQEKIKKCIKDELGENDIIADLLSDVAFIIPDLPAKGFDDAVEGRISKLINKILPGSNYNSNNIYSCVIQDLYRKGQNSFDYNYWQESLRKKAVTRNQFQRILDQHISRKPDVRLETELLSILTEEYHFTSLKRREIVNSFNRYYTRRISEREPLLNKISTEISQIISSKKDEFNTAPELETCLRENLSNESKDFFNNDAEFTGAFLYELIKG